jgi:hypothetical protein
MRRAFRDISGRPAGLRYFLESWEFSAFGRLRLRR